MIKKITKLLRSRKAYSSAPLAVVIALAGMMFFVVLWQIVRLVTISAGVKDAVQSAVSTGDVYGRLDHLLGLQSSGGKHVKTNSDGIEYSVYGLSVNVDNAQFAPTSGDIPQFSATSYISLEVPLSFCGDVLPPMKIRLCVKSKYTPKFDTNPT